MNVDKSSNVIKGTGKGTTRTVVMNAGKFHACLLAAIGVEPDVISKRIRSRPLLRTKLLN